jgi:hypothetical protein
MSKAALSELSTGVARGLVDLLDDEIRIYQEERAAHRR